MNPKFYFNFTHTTHGELDLTPLIELDQREFPYPWTGPEWRAHLKTYGASILTAHEEGAKMVGFVVLLGQPAEEVQHLVKILVAPSHRKSGLAQKMLELVSDYCRSAGAKSIYLEVECTNGPALNFYLKQGFLTLREIKDFYGEGRHALAMAMAIDKRENT